MNTRITYLMAAQEAAVQYSRLTGKPIRNVHIDLLEGDALWAIRLDEARLVISPTYEQLRLSLDQFATEVITPAINRMPSVMLLKRRQEKIRRMKVKSQLKFRPYMHRCGTKYHNFIGAQR